MAIQAAIPFIIAALSAGAGAYQTKRVADSQEKATLSGLRTQREKQREIDARFAQEIGDLEQSSPEDERQQSMEQFMEALRSSRAQRGGGTDIPTGTDRYDADLAAGRAGIQNYGAKLSDILSRIQGGLQQRQNESIGFNRAGSDVDAVARAARNQDALTRLRYGTIARDPWLDAASELGMGVAGGMAGNTGGGNQWMFDAAARTGAEKIPSMIPRGATASSAFGDRMPVPGRRVT
jgi:hypothetical protein